jgi:tight adherence protein C
MNAGALAGLGVGIGLLITLLAVPPARPVRLADRVAPYLRGTPPPSRLLLGAERASGAVAVGRRLFGPLGKELASYVERLAGGSASVRRRLRGLGSSMELEEFRLEQVIWGVCGGLAAGLLAFGIAALRGSLSPVLGIVLALGGVLGGVLGRDWYLGRQLRVREQRMLAEFPVLADLLTLAVVAGEAPVDALARACRLTRGELASDLETVLAATRGGRPFARCLSDLAERTTLEPFARFLDAISVSIERGTPLADVLRAQAIDVREAGKRALLDAGGKKEIAMMGPVVFLILPVTVLFALYPGLITLTELAH